MLITGGYRSASLALGQSRLSQCQWTNPKVYGYIWLGSNHSKIKHGIMTSSNGNIFRVTGPLCGESTDHRGFPSQRRSFVVFFDRRLNKRLSKQRRRQWLETPSCSLWRHWNGICAYFVGCISHLMALEARKRVGWITVTTTWSI